MDTESNSRKEAEEAKKPQSDREKTKAYIQSLKDLMHKQGEQLKKQQSEFKTMLSTLETQHFTARFHSVAFKLELEVLKLFEVLRKV